MDMYSDESGESELSEHNETILPPEPTVIDLAAFRSSATGSMKVPTFAVIDKFKDDHSLPTTEVVIGPALNTETPAPTATMHLTDQCWAVFGCDVHDDQNPFYQRELEEICLDTEIHSHYTEGKYGGPCLIKLVDKDGKEIEEGTETQEKI
jgi:hypothetical protein